jgi:integrase
MKFALKQDTVFEMFREMQGTVKYGAMGPKAPNPAYDPASDHADKKFVPFYGANYLVFDEHKDSPPGFALRVGRTAAIYLVDKRVAGKKLKIPVGLAAGKKGDARPISLAEARDSAWGLAQLAKKHGANPKDITDEIEASELTLEQVWDSYLKFLKSKQPPIKENSELSLRKARQKFSDWESRKVRLITGKEVLARFDLHAIDRGHRTAAEAMGRWATAAVDRAIEREIHDAHAAIRPPSLTYNPFTILRTERRYRTHEQLERNYKAKGIRNPLSFNDTVGPFLKAAWAYRERNPVAADFILLTLLWGMRRGESATFQWRDRITDEAAATGRWIDMNLRVCFVGDPKNRSDHEFPIGPCALELLKLRRVNQSTDESWVFPTSSPLSTKPYLSDPTQAMKTVKESAGIEIVRGHDLRRTFGAACEKLGFSDRQTKRMLGHAISGGESVGRYTGQEWVDLVDRMSRVEDLMLSKAPSVFNALRPRGAARMLDTEDVVATNIEARASSRKPR